MHDDPFETRDRGLRRVRTLTVSLAVASLAGTGLIVYQFARPATADAQQTVQNGGGDGQQGPAEGPSDDDPFGHSNGQVGGGQQSNQGGIQPPAQAPAPAPQFHPHASSGGS